MTMSTEDVTTEELPTRLAAITGQVTQEMIDECIQGTLAVCPIAVALMYNNIDIGLKARVNKDEIRITVGEQWWKLYTPPKERRFIEAFDIDRQSVKPYVVSQLNVANAFDTGAVKHQTMRQKIDRSKLQRDKTRVIRHRKPIGSRVVVQDAG